MTLLPFSTQASLPHHQTHPFSNRPWSRCRSPFLGQQNWTKDPVRYHGTKHGKQTKRNTPGQSNSPLTDRKGGQVYHYYLVPGPQPAHPTSEQVSKLQGESDPQRPRDCVLGCCRFHDHAGKHAEVRWRHMHSRLDGCRSGCHYEARQVKFQLSLIPESGYKLSSVVMYLADLYLNSPLALFATGVSWSDMREHRMMTRSGGHRRNGLFFDFYADE